MLHKAHVLLLATLLLHHATINTHPARPAAIADLPSGPLLIAAGLVFAHPSLCLLAMQDILI
jgi:hypothetical protein